jgi:hypothetical protein
VVGRRAAHPAEADHDRVVHHHKPVPPDAYAFTGADWVLG